MKPHLVSNHVNQLVGKAATVALGLPDHIERERKRNAEVRRYATDFFTKAGYAVTPSAANFLMVDVRRTPRRSARPVGRAACRSAARSHRS